MVLHGPIATNILNVYSAALGRAQLWGVRFSRTANALIAGIVGYLVTIYFVFQPSFAKAFDNWMISLLLWDESVRRGGPRRLLHRRKGRIDVPELYQEPTQSAYGDVNWGGIVAFLVGLVAGWSVEDGLVPALQGPISTKLLGGADFSWLVGIVVAGAVYLALGRRTAPSLSPRALRRGARWTSSCGRDRGAERGCPKAASHRLGARPQRAIPRARPQPSACRRAARSSTARWTRSRTRAASRPALSRECTIYTTLLAVRDVQRHILLYGIPRMIVGENRTFLGEEDLLRAPRREGRGAPMTPGARS
jgi:hypothetical protein